MTTTTLSPLPAGLRIHNAVDGSADIVLGRDKRGDRMVPLFRYSTANGVEYAVAISEHDIVRVMNSLVVLFSGDESEVAAWWRELTGGGSATSGKDPEVG